MKHEDTTNKILRAYYTVYNNLGFGFLEKVYENAMFIELGKPGLLVKRQVPIKVHYDGQDIGDYFADLIINDVVIIELKAVEALCDEHSH